MTYKEIKEWIAKEYAKGGNDLIEWSEIENKVNERTMYYIKVVISIYNAIDIFKVNKEFELAYAEKLLIETLN